jgi:endoglucanase
MRLILCFLLFSFAAFGQQDDSANSWIRINQLGYQPSSVKVAVWCSKDTVRIKTFQLIDAVTKKIVFSGTAGKAFGAYGPFTQTYRLNFSRFAKAGRYYLQAGGAHSAQFSIHDTVYKGAADFCLRYMRQQRCGFNPFLKDSCHNRGCYSLYGSKAGLPDSTYLDISGGWHDASDYLQYVTTSANATYHLLMAYRDFPQAFGDAHTASGLEGKNGVADVLDEARWGLDWLLKMHPKSDWMFNQIADDRDHMGMRIPGLDSFYGRGFQRPAYFVSGELQQRGKFLNSTKGTSSTAAKMSSAFSLGAILFSKTDSLYTRNLINRSSSALSFSKRKLGVTQTASVRSPYIYAEENWRDDMELAYAIKAQKEIHPTTKSFTCGNQFDYILYQFELEQTTPWLGKDTASHYQWYPFINIGHYELLRLYKQIGGWAERRTLPNSRYYEVLNHYKTGIKKVWNKAKANAFYRGVPYIWCSNNLTTSFAIQCYWYKTLAGDKQFEELEQANFDWLFGCNPWGTSMVYGLPSWGDTPADPHSAFTHLKNYPIDGGLVDGPVYGSIYNNLIGIKLYQEDEYAPYQSSLAVYHDDYGDYSTNEPTMDGTASLIYLLAARENPQPPKGGLASPQPTPVGNTATNVGSWRSEALMAPSTGGGRGEAAFSLVFTGDEYGDGLDTIQQALKKANAKASFFFTGRFYRNPAFAKAIRQLKKDGHYLGAHSDGHLLYCDWNERDSLFVTKDSFTNDLLQNYAELQRFGVAKKDAHYFLPPFEWYNDSIVAWTKELGLQLINYSPGTLSHADYTTPADKNYRSSDAIEQSILQYEAAQGLNGLVLLMHVGASSERTDKFYYRLPGLLQQLHKKGYQLVTINNLMKKP